MDGLLYCFSEGAQCIVPLPESLECVCLFLKFGPLSAATALGITVGDVVQHIFGSLFHIGFNRLFKGVHTRVYGHFTQDSTASCQCFAAQVLTRFLEHRLEYPPQRAENVAQSPARLRPEPALIWAASVKPGRRDEACTVLKQPTTVKPASACLENNWNPAGVDG